MQVCTSSSLLRLLLLLLSYLHVQNKLNQIKSKITDKQVQEYGAALSVTQPGRFYIAQITQRHENLQKLFFGCFYSGKWGVNVKHADTYKIHRITLRWPTHLRGSQPLN